MSYPSRLSNQSCRVSSRTTNGLTLLRPAHMTTFSSRPFDALCLLASSENWCWKMACTTCGHLLFRYGLWQLATGQSPCEPAWVVRRDHPVLRRGSPLRELGPIPPLAGWPITQQRRLQQVVSAADISLIAARCNFPDWLGYLGLALHYTEDAEKEDRLLTRAWVGQLSARVSPGSSASGLLATIAADPNSILTWRHLETVESDAA